MRESKATLQATYAKCSTDFWQQLGPKVADDSARQSKCLDAISIIRFWWTPFKCPVSKMNCGISALSRGRVSKCDNATN